jgi:hypothetical protein
VKKDRKRSNPPCMLMLGIVRLEIVFVPLFAAGGQDKFLNRKGISLTLAAEAASSPGAD